MGGVAPPSYALTPSWHTVATWCCCPLHLELLCLASYPPLTFSLFLPPVNPLHSIIPLHSTRPHPTVPQTARDTIREFELFVSNLKTGVTKLYPPLRGNGAEQPYPKFDILLTT